MTTIPVAEVKLSTEPKYDITGLSENQVRTITAALELHMRLGLGQLEFLLEFAKKGEITLADGSTPEYETFEKVEKLMEVIKYELTGYPSGASKGIAHEQVPAASRRAYEMYKVLRFELDSVAGFLNSSTSGRNTEAYVLRVSPEEPLAVIRPQAVVPAAGTPAL